MTTASTSTSVDVSALGQPFTPLHNNAANKRKRTSESPTYSRSTVSPFSDADDDDDDGDDSASSSTTTTPGPRRTPKTNKASAEKDPIRAARLEARAARNRVSAQHSRDRKKNHVQSLEAEVAQLREEKTEMAQRICALEELVKTLLGAGVANAQGVVDPTVTTVSTTPPGLSLLSEPISSSKAGPLPLSLAPSALVQQTSDSLLAAPTSTPLYAVSASLSSTTPLSLTDSNDSTTNDARLPAAEAIESTLSASLTQQRASRKSSLSVKETSMLLDEMRSRLSSEWMSQSMAAAVKQTSCLGQEQDGPRWKVVRQAQKNRREQRDDWTRKATAGCHSTLKASSTTHNRRIIRIRVRMRKVKESASRSSHQAIKMKLAALR